MRRAAPLMIAALIIGWRAITVSTAAQPIPITPVVPFGNAPALATVTPSVLAAPPIGTRYAVYQPFERGAMVWFYDTREIWVLLDVLPGTRAAGTFARFADPYVEGQPEPIAAAPEGLLAPVRGFGVVWRLLDAERALGWATATEAGYDARVTLEGGVQRLAIADVTGVPIAAFTLIDRWGVWVGVGAG